MAPKIKKLDTTIVFDSYVARAWFHAKRAKFHYLDVRTNEIKEFSEVLFLKYMIGEGFFDSILAAASVQKGSGLSLEEEARLKKISWTQFLHAVMKNKEVDWVGELGGIPVGLFLDNGYRCLIEKGPTYIEPKEGNCSFIEKIMSEVFPGIQVHIIEAWAARVYEQKRDPEAVFICQIPIMVGARDCGKSLVKDEIFIPLFGGRYADAISFITGSNFNSELIRADLGIIDDQNFDTRFDQDVTSDRIKKWAADRNKRIEKKHQPAINVHVKIPLMILLNTGSKNLRLLPDRTEDIEDKILGFLCGKAELPKGKNHEKIIRDKIQKERPAYLYKLLHKRDAPPGIISKGRFGIVPFYHPELLKMREEEDFAISILELIERYMTYNNLTAGWSRTAGELFREMTEYPYCRTALLSYCKNSKALGWQLSKLLRMRPERVSRSNRGTHGAVYVFAGDPDPSPETGAQRDSSKTAHF